MTLGEIIFSIEDFNSIAPTAKISIVTIKAAIYSNLAWPYGCSLSAGFAAILNPNSVTALLDVSDKLFIASAIIVMLLPMIPIKSLKANKMVFTTIPIIPAVVPYLKRTVGFFVSL